LAAAEVAERAGAIALQTHQKLVGVVENMSGLLLPDGTTMQLSARGGGRQVAERLSIAVGCRRAAAGQVPLDPALVAAAIRCPAGCSVRRTPRRARSYASRRMRCSSRKRGLAGMSLGLDPAGR